MASVKHNFGRQKKEPQDPTKVPTGIDSSTFMSPAIPEEVKSAVPAIHAVPQENYAPLLRRFHKYMQDRGEMSDQEYHALQSKDFADVEFSTVLTGLFTLTTLITKLKTKLSTVATDLEKINMPVPFIDLFVRMLRSARAGFELLAVDNNFRFPRLRSFRWRVDVTISSSSLSRILKPSIMMQMCLSNGVRKTFQLSVEQFSQIRYGVAKVLLDMQTLDRHPIMRIVNEFDRKDKEERNK